MDEPTAALGVTEANKLLGLIRNLKDRGLSILLITQRIPDILAIADRVFVLKGGQRQDVLEVSQVTLDDVVTMIVRGKEQRGRDGTLDPTSSISLLDKQMSRIELARPAEIRHHARAVSADGALFACRAPTS